MEQSSSSSASQETEIRGSIQTCAVVPFRSRGHAKGKSSAHAVQASPLEPTSTASGAYNVENASDDPAAEPCESDAASTTTLARTSYHSAYSSTDKRIEWSNDSVVELVENKAVPLLRKEADRHRDRMLQCLEDLKANDIFAQRYRIESSPRRLLDVLAIDVNTGQKVLLKFYLNTYTLFKATMEMHEYLANEGLVCRMIEAIENVPCFPPCLVLERGDFSLADVFTRSRLSTTDSRAILYDILRSVDSIHRLGIVHGDVTPEKIVWFSSESKWKLLDLSTCRWRGNEGVWPSRLEYMAPEVLQSKNKKTLLLQYRSADMWSVGIIAHRLLTGERFYGQKPSAQYVTNVLRFEAPLPEMLTDSQAEQSLLHKILSTNPKTRLTTSEALCSDVFGRDEALQHACGLNEVNENAFTAESVDHAAFLRRAAEQLHLSVGVECFCEGSDPVHPFHSRQTKDVLHMKDKALPDDKIYYFRHKRKYLLRICIEDELGLPLRIGCVDYVKMKLPDSPTVTLETELIENHNKNGQEIVALLDLMNCRSPVKRKKFGMFDRSEMKHMRLELIIRVQHDGKQPLEFNARRAIYYKTISQYSSLYCARFVRRTEQAWALLSRPMRRGLKCINPLQQEPSEQLASYDSAMDIKRWKPDIA